MGGACFGGCLGVLNFEKWREWFNKPLAIFSSLLACSKLTWRIAGKSPKIFNTQDMIHSFMVQLAMSPHVIFKRRLFQPRPPVLSEFPGGGCGVAALLLGNWATGQVRWRPGGCFVVFLRGGCSRGGVTGEP